MSTQELQAQLEALASAEEDALTKATDFAEEHNLEFTFSPAYGMGGWYKPVNCEGGYGETGWNPSSQNC